MLTNDFFDLTVYLLAIVHILLLFFFTKRGIRIVLSVVVSFVPLLLAYSLFLFKGFDNGVSWYGLFMPASILASFVTSELMFLSSYYAYKSTFSHVERWLSIFYGDFTLNWLIIFMDYIFSIGSSSPDTHPFVRFAGATMLNLALLQALAMFFIGKYMFYPNLPKSDVFERSLFIIYGIAMGLNWGAPSALFTPEPINAYALFLPQPLSFYGTMNGFFAVVPQFVVSFYAFKFAKHSLDKNLLPSIDPLLVPRIKLIGRATLVFAIGVTLSFIVLFLPFLINIPFVASFGPWLATIMFVPVSIIFYLAFQSPESLRTIFAQ